MPSIKKEVAERFVFTKDGYRDRFNAIHPQLDMAFKKYGPHFKKVWTRWAELFEADTMEKVAEMIVMNQLMNTVSKEVRSFLTERNPKSFSEVIEMGSNYTRTHPGIPFGKQAVTLCDTVTAVGWVDRGPITITQ